MPHIIYCITNTLDGKCYVGQTRSKLNTRMSQHRGASRRGTGHNLGRAIAKHGWGAFTVEVLEETDAAGLDMAERFWIAARNSMRPNGYNLDSGGQRQGVRCEDTVSTMSQAQAWRIGVPRADETKALISASLTGKTHSAKTKAKMSASHKAIPLTPEVSAMKAAASNKRWAAHRARTA